jgi:hypothetical protein
MFGRAGEEKNPYPHMESTPGIPAVVSPGSEILYLPKLLCVLLFQYINEFNTLTVFYPPDIATNYFDSRSIILFQESVPAKIFSGFHSTNPVAVLPSSVTALKSRY